MLMKLTLFQPVGQIILFGWKFVRPMPKSVKRLGTPTIVLRIYAIALIIVLSYAQSATINTNNASAQSDGYQPCNCVIFRLDDVVDSALSAPNIAIMNHFIAENKKLDNLMVLSNFGNSAPSGTVYNKVKEGFEKGLFELAIHGWSHVAYSGLTAEQQQNDFIQANNKLQSLFGTKSRIFGPPFNEFNSGTVKTMAGSGLDILSTAYSYESRVTNPYKTSTIYTTNNSIIQLSEVNTTESETGVYEKTRIYHVPFSVSLYNLIGQGYAGEALTQEVLRRVDNNIAIYGFSLVTLHPNDVAAYNANTGKWRNSVDPSKMQVLTDIVDQMEAKGISFSDLRDVSPAPFSEVIPKPVFTTTLALNPITSVTWGKEVSVTGKLIDQSGSGVGGATITFDGTGASNLASTVTNSDGSFTTMGSSPNSVATQWTVQAHFSGNQDYQPSNSIVRTYSTTKHAVSISVQVANPNVSWGTGTTFTATLADSTTGGPVIAGRTIRFDGNGVIEVANQTTSDNGKAIGKGIAPNSVANGWNYQAHFDGDSLYLKKDSSIRTYNTIKRNVAFTLALTPSLVSSGQSYIIGTTLSDFTSNNSPIVNRTITFTADPPITPSQQKTDSQGKTRETLNAPSASGTYDIQAFFGGDDLYNAKSSLPRTLNVSGSSSAASTQQASSEPTTNLSASSMTTEEPLSPSIMTTSSPHNSNTTTASSTVSSLPTTIPPEDTATVTMNTTAPTTTITPNNLHNSSFSTSPNTNSGDSYQGPEGTAHYQSRPFASPLVTAPLEQQLPLNSSSLAPASPLSPSTSASVPALQSLPQPHMPLTTLPPSYSPDINTSPDTTIISAVDASTGLNIQNGQTVPLLSSIILTFSGSELPIAGFQCSIDGQPSIYCTPPAIVDNKQLASVSTTGISSTQPSSRVHTFQVSAVDAAGNTDLSPASFEWNVINSIKSDPLASDKTAPDTQIMSAVDSNNAAVLNGSSTSIYSSSSASPVTSQLSAPGSPANMITFSFAATDDSDIITGYECTSYSSSSPPEQITFVPCTNPAISQIPVESSTSSTGTGTETHIFQVRARDASGNVDPSPATFQWTDTPTTGDGELAQTRIGTQENPIGPPETLLPQLQTPETLLPQLQTPETLLPQLQTLPTSHEQGK